MKRHKFKTFGRSRYNILRNEFKWWSILTAIEKWDPSLKLTFSHLKIGLNPQKEAGSSSNRQFSGWELLVSVRVRCSTDFETFWGLHWVWWEMNPCVEFLGNTYGILYGIPTELSMSICIFSFSLEIFGHRDRISPFLSTLAPVWKFWKQNI